MMDVSYEFNNIDFSDGYNGAMMDIDVDVHGG